MSGPGLVPGQVGPAGFGHQRIVCGGRIGLSRGGSRIARVDYSSDHSPGRKAGYSCSWGLTPNSPVMTVRPVLLTVEAPRTAKVRAAPSGGADCPAQVAHAQHENNQQRFFHLKAPWLDFSSSGVPLGDQRCRAER